MSESTAPSSATAPSITLEDVVRFIDDEKLDEAALQAIQQACEARTNMFDCVRLNRRLQARAWLLKALALAGIVATVTERTYQRIDHRVVASNHRDGDSAQGASWSGRQLCSPRRAQALLLSQLFGRFLTLEGQGVYYFRLDDDEVETIGSDADNLSLCNSTCFTATELELLADCLRCLDGCL